METRKLFQEDGTPRYIRCYDDPYTADRYTVVYTGRYRKGGDQFLHVGMSAYPYHPQGICQHGESDDLIDRPAYSHLGKKIGFNDLPEQCRRFVMGEYKELWSIQ